MIRIVKDFFVRNWILKLLSFLMALILWLVLIPEEKVISERTLNIRLETQNVPGNMELVVKPASSIDVTLRAAKRVLDEISDGDVTARLDLAGATVQQTEYPLNAQMIALPPGAEVVRIIPNQVELKLEMTRSVELKVRPHILGKVKEGFTYRVDVIPDTVLVEGPESKIQSKDEVRTAPVDISNLAQSTVYYVDLILPKPELRLATGETKVRVNVIVQDIESAKASPKRK